VIRPRRIDRLLSWLYAAILRAYPPVFRGRAGSEILRAFRDGLEKRSAPFERVWWALRELADVGRNLVSAWLETGMHFRNGRTPMGEKDGVTTGRLKGQQSSILDGFGHDVRMAVRGLVRRPGFAAFVSGTLALGIGANAAVFSLLHSVLLAPLPYDEPERLVRMYWDGPGEEGPSYMVDPAFLDYRENLTSVQIAAVDNYGDRDTGADILVEGQPERVRVLRVSADYFDVLGADIIQGRPFSRDDERADAAVALVSERLWRRAIRADAGAVGNAISLDGVSHRVSGVVSGDFVDPLKGIIDVWIPEDFDPSRGQWGNERLTVLGRLAPGVSLTRARAEVDRRSALQMESLGVAPDLARGVLVPLHADLVGPSEPMLLILMGSVVVLFLITCTNMGALVLARGVARSRELSVRTALGSGRGRLVRQLVIESLVLASIGACAGLAAGALVQGALVAVAPADLPQAADLVYGSPVALLAGALALVVGLVVGGVPALQVTRGGLEAGIRDEMRAGAEQMRHRSFRRALVVAEVSLAMVLLVAAGLFLSSLERLRSLELGVDADDVWTFLVHLPDIRYADAAERVRFHAALQSRLRSIPGVENVGAASRLPATGHYHGSWGTRAEGDDRVVGDAQNRVVQGDWFGALDVELLQGRLFAPQDGPDDPRRVVVSESLASRLFPGESALGRRIVVLGDPLEIIGVVEEVPLTPRGQPAPTVYHAHEQFADNRNWPLFQVVEMHQPAPGLVESARGELAALDPNLILIDAEPLSAVLGRETARDAFVSLLISIFAVLAISLAALGIYGILSYDVNRSRHEIGVRMALGAGAAEVRRLVVRRGLVLTGAGVAAGTVGALAGGRVLQSLLFEVDPHDPRIAAAAAIILLAIGAAASWIPARRATSVEPAEAFRGR
jgi:predicted permease